MHSLAVVFNYQEKVLFPTEYKANLESKPILNSSPSSNEVKVAAAALAFNEFLEHVTDLKARALTCSPRELSRPVLSDEIPGDSSGMR